MTARKQKTRPSQDASTPFFARFLENQQGGDADAKAPAEFMTLKYPSDRDEIDPDSPVHTEAAPTEAAPSRMTLKYPSDRDEIDWYAASHGNAADAR